MGPVEAVDAHEEAGEGLARAGGRGDERVAAGGDVRPALAPAGAVGPVGEAAPEPLGHRRVEPGQGRVHRWPGGQEGSGTAVMYPFSRMGVTLIQGLPCSQPVRAGSVVGSERLDS